VIAGTPYEFHSQEDAIGAAQAVTWSRKTGHRKLEFLMGMRFFGKQESRDEKEI